MRLSSEMTVSVIVPTHNRVALLERALRSVVRQTRPADEVLVVDDGSTDDTAAMVRREFPMARYEHQAHKGVAAARNHGVERSQGAWIAFLDSDDEWLPRKLEQQISAIQANADYRLCHADEIWIRRGKRVNPKARHAKSGGFIFRQCLPLCVISPSTVMLQRSLLDELGGFDETFPVCEDYDLWLRVCSRYPVLFVPEPLVIKHGGHADQLSRRYWGMDRFRIRSLEGIIESAHLAAGDRDMAVSELLGKIAVYSQGARRRGKVEEADAFDEKRRKYVFGLAQVSLPAHARDA